MVNVTVAYLDTDFDRCLEPGSYTCTSVQSPDHSRELCTLDSTHIMLIRTHQLLPPLLKNPLLVLYDIVRRLCLNVVGAVPGGRLNPFELVIMRQISLGDSIRYDDYDA